MVIGAKPWEDYVLRVYQKSLRAGFFDSANSVLDMFFPENKMKTVSGLSQDLQVGLQTCLAGGPPVLVLCPHVLRAILLSSLGGRLRGPGRSVGLEFDHPWQGGQRRVQCKSPSTTSGVWVRCEPGVTLAGSGMQVVTDHHQCKLGHRDTWQLPRA